MKPSYLLIAAALGLALAGCGTPPAPTGGDDATAESPSAVSTVSATSDYTATSAASTVPSESVSASASPSETATAGPTSAPTQTPPASQTPSAIVVVQSNASLAVTCRSAELIVQAENSVIVADGACVGVIVVGHQNRITVADASGDVHLYGNNNQFTYSGTVTVKDLGTGNVLTRR